ncbi:MAG: hypothetical protein ACXITV_09330 [Luteibaculaceae bacterium]
MKKSIEIEKFVAQIVRLGVYGKNCTEQLCYNNLKLRLSLGLSSILLCFSWQNYKN